MTDLLLVVRRLGGVARTTSLRDAGVSRHHLAAAVASGVLQRLCRGWVAIRAADPALVMAARAGAVITCITAAERLGLWVLTRDAVPHLGTDGHGHPRPSGRAHVHWCDPAVPRHPDALVDPIENVLAIAASCVPFEAALTVWESALRQGLITVESMSRLALVPAARRLLIAATPWSESGLESLVVPRLSWLRLPIRAQVWIAGHRVDFLIGDRLVLQIDGATHTGSQRDADNEHDAALMLMGYHVIRVGYTQVVHRWHEVQELVMRAVGQGLHRAAA